MIISRNMINKGNYLPLIGLISMILLAGGSAILYRWANTPSAINNPIHAPVTNPSILEPTIVPPIAGNSAVNEENSADVPDDTLPAINLVKLFWDALIVFGDDWLFLDDGSDLGTAWRELEFDDSDWRSGAAMFGYGDGVEETTISYGPEYGNKYIASYFRHTFQVEDPAKYSSLRLQLMRDDGAVVYLNGVEILRSNMPATEIGYRTLALNSIGNEDEANVIERSINPELLKKGDNLLAIEIHQATTASSDVHFDAALLGITHIALISPGSVWHYNDSGNEIAADWVTDSYSIAGWQSGAAKFGYGEGDETTLINAGASEQHRPITAYFRQNFHMQDVTPFSKPLTLRILFDDGAIVYLNGEEVYRGNMPGGEVDFQTLASSALWGENQSIYREIAISPHLLREGENVVAVEIHQAGPETPDMSFDLSLMYDTRAPLPPANLKKQSATDDAIFFEWEGGSDSFAVVGYAIFQNDEKIAETQNTYFLASGLEADTNYRYTVSAFDVAGNYSEASQPLDAHTNAPQSACQGELTFATIGDFGNASVAEQAVSDLIHSWNSDFIATLGDNNYPDGAAETIDDNIGQFYHDFIYPYVGTYGEGADKNRFFPVLGGHDWRADNAQAHFDYFELPGNERYYDVVWGSIHLFMLSSEPFEPDGVAIDSLQIKWFQEKLAASTAPWQVVLMHNPPYSSGDRHGSSPWLQFPFAEWGVDAVMSGDEHLYERIVVDDIPYFVNGLGGATWLYDFNDEPVIGSESRYNGGNGAMRILVAPDCMQFEFVTIAGIVADSYILRR